MISGGVCDRGKWVLQKPIKKGNFGTRNLLLLFFHKVSPFSPASIAPPVCLLSSSSSLLFPHHPHGFTYHLAEFFFPLDLPELLFFFFLFLVLFFFTETIGRPEHVHPYPLDDRGGDLLRARHPRAPGIKAVQLHWILRFREVNRGGEFCQSQVGHPRPHRCQGNHITPPVLPPLDAAAESGRICVLSLGFPKFGGDVCLAPEIFWYFWGKIFFLIF